MFTYRLKLFLFGLGVTTMAAGFLSYHSLPFEKSFRFSFASVSKPLSLMRVLGPSAPVVSGDWGTIKAEFDVAIDSPPGELRLGDAIVLQLQATLREVIYTLPPDPQDVADLPSVPQFSSEELHNMIRGRMRRGEVTFKLSLAGADFEPSGNNPISESGRALWSVKPDEPGWLRGFVQPTFLRVTGGREGMHRIEYSADEYFPIEIKVEEPLVTPRAVVSVAVSFFGSLLTLPGILAFLDKRRQRRKERENQEEEARRPRIILPDGRSYNARDRDDT